MLGNAVKVHVNLMVRMMRDAALKDDVERLMGGMLESAQGGNTHAKDLSTHASTAIKPAPLGENRRSRHPPDVHPC